MDRTTMLALALALSAIPAFGVNSGGTAPPAEATPTTPGTRAPINLAEAQDRAMRSNPELAAAAAAVRAADGAWRQARAFPNPDFSIDYDGFGGKIPEQTEAQTLYALEQLVEIGGKRGARSRERELARTVSQGDAEVRRRDVLAEVKRRFVGVLGLQERGKILEGALRTAETVQRTVHELVVAGEVSPIEELKVESDASLARIDLRAAASGLAVARQKLAEMWGRRVPDFGDAAGELDMPTTLPSRGDLEQRMASLPDFARGEADVSRLEAALESEKKKRIPDLTLNAGVQQYRAYGDHSYVAGVKIPFPLFDRNAGSVAEASSRLEQGRYERAAAEARIVGALSSAHERLTATADEAVALHDTVLPKARQVLEGIEEGYRRGKFRLLDLLDARRSLAAAELRYNDALVELNLAEAEVERWTGTPMIEAQGGTR
jgi:cobalt-zinc-cadmium efflux system outer membrane protein